MAMNMISENLQFSQDLGTANCPDVSRPVHVGEMLASFKAGFSIDEFFATIADDLGAPSREWLCPMDEIDDEFTENELQQQPPPNFVNGPPQHAVEEMPVVETPHCWDYEQDPLFNGPWNRTARGN